MSRQPPRKASKDPSKARANPRSARKSIVGLYTEIQRYAIQDGPGIRTSVFLKGCPLRCDWCHNPENQDKRPEITRLPERCIGCGACAEACPEVAPGSAAEALAGGDRCRVCGLCAEACVADARRLVGQQITASELVALLERERPFYDESSGGVTFSGGEPLMQGAFLLACLEALGGLGIHTAVDTCGFADTAFVEEVARFANLFLYDLKLMDEESHRRHTGAPLGLILDNLRALDAAGAHLWIRVPVIPGVNDSEENIGAIGRFVSSLEGQYPIYLLPYHKLGADKYRRRNTPYALAETEPPSREVLERLGGLLVDMGLQMYIKE